METQEQKTERNCRVQARYEELMLEGKHGHYETIFRVVREEVELERERCVKVCDDAHAAIWEFHDKQVRDTAENVCINLAMKIRGA